MRPIEVPTASEMRDSYTGVVYRDAAALAAIIASDPILRRIGYACEDREELKAVCILLGLQIAAMRAEDDREDLRAADINDRD